jgi:hypothetical protein
MFAYAEIWLMLKFCERKILSYGWKVVLKSEHDNQTRSWVGAKGTKAI